MRSYVSSSLVFRLWAALSLVATVFTTAALLAYTWLAIDDSIEIARKDVDAKVQVALVRMSRTGLTPEPPTTREVLTAGGLGIVRAEILASDGAAISTVHFLDRQVAGTSLPAEAVTSGELRQTVRLSGNQVSAQSLSPWQVLRGGDFGEERVVALDAMPAGGPAYLRTLVAYPDLTAEANAQILRSLLTGLIIIVALLAGIWPLLNGFVARPLRRYSELARRISNGEPVRMPVDERGELGDLARSVNAMAESLEREATVDVLTGLYNLRHLGINLEVMIAEATARGQPLSLVIADLDNLKPVNDTLGHQAGDEILRAVSAGLKAWRRSQYTCWRLGGDEFVLVLPGLDAEQAMRCAEELKAVVAAISLPIGDTIVRPSISVGVAHCPEDGSTASELMGIADRRMYEEKALRVDEKNLLLVS